MFAGALDLLTGSRERTHVGTCRFISRDPCGKRIGARQRRLQVVRVRSYWVTKEFCSEA